MPEEKDDKPWVPELTYYDSSVDGPMTAIPFILVPDGEKMPDSLLISENRKETQLIKDEEGKEVLQEVMTAEITMYVNLTSLKEKLDKKTYQKIWKATKKPKNYIK